MRTTMLKCRLEFIRKFVFHAFYFAKQKKKNKKLDEHQLCTRAQVILLSSVLIAIANRSSENQLLLPSAFNNNNNNHNSNIFSANIVTVAITVCVETSSCGKYRLYIRLHFTGRTVIHLLANTLHKLIVQSNKCVECLSVVSNSKFSYVLRQIVPFLFTFSYMVFFLLLYEIGNATSQHEPNANFIRPR